MGGWRSLHYNVVCVLKVGHESSLAVNDPLRGTNKRKLGTSEVVRRYGSRNAPKSGRSGAKRCMRLRRRIIRYRFGTCGIPRITRTVPAAGRARHSSGFSTTSSSNNTLQRAKWLPGRRARVTSVSTRSVTIPSSARLHPATLSNASFVDKVSLRCAASLPR